MLIMRYGVLFVVDYDELSSIRQIFECLDWALYHMQVKSKRCGC